MDEEESIKQ